MKVKVIKKSLNKLPEYKTDGSAGLDVCSNSKQTIIIPPNSSTIVPTGLYVELEKGYELQVRPRSGLAAKNSITVLNSPGTIDSDYRGEIGVILINHGTKPFTIYLGDRIAQFVLAKYEQITWEEVDELSGTERGEGGFGSTGK